MAIMSALELRDPDLMWELFTEKHAALGLAMMANRLLSLVEHYTDLDRAEILQRYAAAHTGRSAWV